MNNDIYWLNKDSRKFLERGYLLEGETAEQRIKDIAKAAEKYLNIVGFADKFEGYMSRGFYSLSSPVWSNFGRERGLPISCFGSYICDTLECIFEKVAEVGTMTAGGGGTSAYFGDIRGRGTPISSGGESTGSVHFMELYNKLMNVVSQGNVRRGSFAAYLPIDHPDIEEFLKIRSEGNEIQDMSIGVCVSDSWMKKMLDGDKEARKIWGQVIKKRFESGYPYIFFTDNANNQAPQIYKDKGLTINNSNLCVTGDTRIEILINGDECLEIPIVDLGYYMKRYINVKVRSFDIETNQEVYSTIEAFAQTGESIDLIEIEDEDGNVIKCTPEHQIYTKNRGYVQAQDLREDDVLETLKNNDE
jgi:ribonucleoside-diphosphate reductase alpha chain